MRRLEEYIDVGQKRLRCGYTTGTCAAAAAHAAAELLLLGEAPACVVVGTPAGVDVVVDVEECASGDGWAQCAVRKDAGDDPDVTDGILVVARVAWDARPGVQVEGGEGVGRVTRAGLDQPVGAAAINSVPRGMIVGEVEGVLEVVRSASGGGMPCSDSPRFVKMSTGHFQSLRNCAWHPAPAGGAALFEREKGGGSMLKQSSLWKIPTGDFRRCGTARGASPLPPQAALISQEDIPQYHSGCVVEPGEETSFALEGVPLGGEGESCDPLGGVGVLVTISVPGGAEVAARTFNPRLGIEGGISIIGTSGIVKPMSEEAMVASIQVEMRMLAAQGVRDLLVVPGNYGRDFARDALGLNVEQAVQCSNYFGDTLDAAVRLGFAQVLLVGHLGKMAKVAGGIMNTHSRVADCRMEVLAAHAALAGAPQQAVRDVMGAATTDAALDVLAGCGLLEPAMDSLVTALGEKLAQRAGGKLQVEAIVFSNKHGLLGKTAGAAALMREWEGGGR